MALLDDLQGLAAEDVVYLSRSIQDVGGPTSGGGISSVYRGRLRQGTDGGWVFSTFTGQNGLVGFVLGQPGQNGDWNSTPTTSGNATVSITSHLTGFTDPQNGIFVQLQESILLSEVIPAAFVQ